MDFWARVGRCKVWQARVGFPHKIKQEDVEQESCPHPQSARIHGGNQWGNYIHCEACTKRVWFYKFTGGLV